jgi:hypothetical protein
VLLSGSTTLPSVSRISQTHPGRCANGLGRQLAGGSGGGQPASSPRLRHHPTPPPPPLLSASCAAGVGATRTGPLLAPGRVGLTNCAFPSLAFGGGLSPASSVPRAGGGASPTSSVSWTVPRATCWYAGSPARISPEVPAPVVAWHAVGEVSGTVLPQMTAKSVRLSAAGLSAPRARGAALHLADLHPGPLRARVGLPELVSRTRPSSRQPDPPGHGSPSHVTLASCGMRAACWARCDVRRRAVMRGTWSSAPWG